MNIAQAKELLGEPPTTKNEAMYKFVHALTLLFAFSEPDEDKLNGFTVPCQYKGEQYRVRVEKPLPSGNLGYDGYGARGGIDKFEGKTDG